ncbi:benzoate 4-monooxygenase cytochrome p450 [Thozetella sp. PMI_491]|nr:benzoate 4-monooxygenase cytochrome p450 [Thozetella sp. PMI_491]
MALLTLPVIFAGAIAIILMAIILRLRSPMSAIPGPKLGLFSSLPLKYHEFTANRTKYIHSLHQKYGKVVRIAPNEVAFTSLDAMKEIYMSSGSGYDKTEFYYLFKQYGTSERRRILADRYANSNVVREHALDGLRERSKSFVAKCNELPKREMDVYIYLHCYAFDGVTHHLFHPHGSNSINEVSDEEIMREVSFDNSLARRLLEYYNPVLGSLVDRLSILPPGRAIPRAKALVLNAVEKGDAADFTLLSRMKNPKLGLHDIEMAAECMDHMAAGIETTGDTLCWLMWQISQPEFHYVQERLHAEFEKLGDVPFDQFPYLDAVVKEGLRVFPSIPMSLPRVVPKGGRSIDGYWLPEGTIVSCQSYTMHRWDEDVFPEPDRFRPERWLDVESEPDRNRIFFAFSNGGRGCLGRHLAMAEMKILLRDVYSTFRTTLAEGMTADMSMADQIISSRPKDQKCLITFVPLK